MRWWISHSESVCIDCCDELSSLNFFSNAAWVNPDMVKKNDDDDDNKGMLIQLKRTGDLDELIQNHSFRM